MTTSVLTLNSTLPCKSVHIVHEVWASVILLTQIIVCDYFILTRKLGHTSNRKTLGLNLYQMNRNPISGDQLAFDFLEEANFSFKPVTVAGFTANPSTFSL